MSDLNGHDDELFGKGPFSLLPSLTKEQHLAMMTEMEGRNDTLCTYAAQGDPALDELTGIDSEKETIKYKHIVYDFLFFLHALISIADFKLTGDLNGQVDYEKSQFYKIQYYFERAGTTLTDVREEAVSLFQVQYLKYATPTEVDAVVNGRVYPHWNYSPLHEDRKNSYK